jgi:hypothetical protein
MKPKRNFKWQKVKWAKMEFYPDGTKNIVPTSIVKYCEILETDENGNWKLMVEPRNPPKKPIGKING